MVPLKLPPTPRAALQHYGNSRLAMQICLNVIHQIGLFVARPTNNKWPRIEYIKPYNMRDRIKQLMESLHMNQKAFAQATGINEGTLSGILNEKTKPSMQTVEAIHNRLSNISIKWLMFGEGPMYEASARVTPADKDAEPTANGNGLANGGSSPAAGTTASASAGTSSASSGINGTLSLFDISNTPNNSRRPQAGSQTKEREVVKYIDKPTRKITEIRVFYDDQTWESFVPKK